MYLLCGLHALSWWAVVPLHCILCGVCGVLVQGMRDTITSDFNPAGMPGTGLYHTDRFDMARQSQLRFSQERTLAARNRRAFVARMYVWRWRLCRSHACAGWRGVGAGEG